MLLLATLLTSVSAWAYTSEELSTPLTLEFPSTGSGGTVTVKEPKSGMQYSINGGDNKMPVTDNDGEEDSRSCKIAVSAGQTVQFYGNGTRITSYHGTEIACSADCYIYGNIMSLVDEENFATATTLTETKTFYKIFHRNSHLKNHTDATKKLLLPATTLSNSCYASMFSKCTGLTTAPELPAETLAESCYFQMFSGCTSLTTAPTLPAETLAESCYLQMFSGCTSLTTAPALPAETLADNCYQAMFDGCTNLTTAPALPAETLTENCYRQMFRECTNLTTAPALPAETLAKSCYLQMFYGCTSLTTAPTLPAETLAESCYRQMFYGCTSLNYVKCMATNLSTTSCTTDWLKNVAENGTFVKAFGPSWRSGSSGIPSGWTASYPNTTYTIQFDANGGSGTMESQEFYYTEAQNLTANTFMAPTGKLFNGWNTQPNGSGTSYSDQQSILALTTEENGIVTLYAQWVDDIPYTIHYDANGGSGEMNDQTFSYYVPQNLTANTFTRSGMYFVRWTTQADGGGKRYSDQQRIQGLTSVENGTVTLYAQWEQNTTPLTLEAFNGDITVTINNTNKLTIKYEKSSAGASPVYDTRPSFNDETKVFTLSWNNGNPDKLKLYGNGTNNTSYEGVTISCSTTNSGECYVHGNIMSLVDEENFNWNFTLTGNNTFKGLFAGNTLLIHAQEKLLLPATTLTQGCYEGMFSGCTGLATAPDLPASTLTKDCYKSMFSGCTYLTTAPDLSAETLTEGCYNNMFNGCTRLNYVKCLATNRMATDCTSDWLTGTAATGTFVRADDASWNEGIPDGWTVEGRSVIRFNANGGSGTMADMTLEPGETQTLTLAFTAPEGKVFTHWNTAADNTGTNYIYVGGQTIGNQPQATITLYAQWAEEKYTEPLTFQAVEAGNITITNPLGLTMKYSKNGGVKTTIGGNTDEITIPVQADDVIRLYGNGTDNKTYYNINGFISYTNIQCSDNCYIYGNIMSLVDEIGYATNVTLTDNYTFSMLFNQNPQTQESTALKNHPEKALLLPATTLTESCYAFMFQGCTSLTTAPELPATTLTKWCYDFMFSNCKGLTTAPALPAETLAEVCYQAMFMNCTSLTTAPALPAETLAEGCYENMFQGCTNLNYVKCLATDLSASNCTNDWLLNVASSGTFVKNNADMVNNSSWSTGTSGIPSGWTVIPIDPATEEVYKVNLAENISASILINETATTVNYAPNECTVTLGYGIPLSEGYTVVYTVSKAGGGEVEVADDNGVCTFVMPACEVTVTAEQTKITYTISFDANGGSGTMENQQFTYDVAQNLTANTFMAPTGKLFNGWNTQFNGNGTSYSDQQRILGLTTENNAVITLFAQWVDLITIPLTLEFPSGGSGGTVTISNPNGLTIKYSIGNGEKQTVGGSTDNITITVPAGQAVQLYGNNAAYSDDGSSAGSTIISCSADCYIYGNIMSLVNETGFATNVTLTAENTFRNLFYNNTHLKNHTDATKKLVLPATKLTYNCYSSMFEGCTGLTIAPELPATTLAESCYHCMFWGCTNLTTAPELPATTLAGYCYSNMFYQCRNLKTAPELPATTLAANCYSGMFSSCTNLTTAPALPATTLAERCYAEMFNGCTNLTTAPELPATTLVDCCYYMMFSACGELNYVKCLATNLAANDYTGGWLSSVASFGTFVKVNDVNWERGESGIPSGWTVRTKYGAITINDNGTTKEAFIDGTSTEAVSISADITVNSVTFNRTFTADKPATLMLPFSIATSNVSGAAFYTFGGVSYDETEQKWIATMNAVSGTLTANTPYLVMPSATGQITFSIPDGGVAFNTTGGGGQQTADPGSHWTFKGTYSYREWVTGGANESEIGKVYGFAGVAKTGISVGDFVKVASGAKIRPMGCYLLWSDTPNAARSMNRAGAAEELPSRIAVRLVDSNGEITAIGTLDTQTGEMTFDSEAWYTLNGVRLNGKPTTKGIYINNGKTVVIK